MSIHALSFKSQAMFSSLSFGGSNLLRSSITSGKSILYILIFPLSQQLAMLSSPQPRLTTLHSGCILMYSFISLVKSNCLTATSKKPKRSMKDSFFFSIKEKS